MTTDEETNDEKQQKKNVLKEILVAAYEDYSRNGVSTVRCPDCSGIVEFKPISETTLEVSCPCGLIKDTLRGL